jgi:uncharacterized protein YvpB
MIKIQCKDGIPNTIIKSDPIQSSLLGSIDKFNLKETNTLEIKSYEFVDNHIKFTLEQPIKGRLIWYAFAPHVDVISDEIIKSVKLPVPHYSQRDNLFRMGQTCNVTCCAMIIRFFYPNLKTKQYGQLEDELLKYCERQWGKESIYYHDNLVRLLEVYGVRSVFSTNTPFTKVREHLASGNPAIYSGRFTRSGHIICLIGYDEKGFIVNDPWGEWYSTGYQNKSGASLHYSNNLISNVSYSGRDKGWIHLCSKL